LDAVGASDASGDLERPVDMNASQHEPGGDAAQGHQSSDGPYRTGVPGTKALIVEDDQNSRFALGVLLERAGFTVVAATNGAAAIQTLKHRPDVDLALMDIMMPLMDGYKTMAAIRKIPECKDLPIIAVTAKTTDGERERCVAAGASDYIPKPINAAEFLEAVQRWLAA
jgi:CheY-like chemotaxis protein